MNKITESQNITGKVVNMNDQISSHQGHEHHAHMMKENKMSLNEATDSKTL